MENEVVLTSEDDPNEELDLGHMVAIWHVVQAPDGGKQFDLIEREDIAFGHIDLPPTMQRTIAFDADRLPAGAAIVMTFPKEVTRGVGETGERNEEPGAGGGDTG